MFYNKVLTAFASIIYNSYKYEKYIISHLKIIIKIYLNNKLQHHLELRRNELGLRFLYKLRSNTTYTEFLNTLDNREDQRK